MDANRVAEIKTNLSSKDTAELLDIWKMNDRATYTDDAFEAVRVLLDERSVAIPPQSKYIPEEDRPEYYQWDVSAVKRTRTIYLILFLLMVVANIGGAFIYSGGAIIGNIVFGILFLIIFMRLAKNVLHYSIGNRIALSFVILFIPYFSLLAIAILDRKIYNAIKKKRELFL